MDATDICIVYIDYTFIQEIDISPHPPKKFFSVFVCLSAYFYYVFFSVAGVLPRPEGSDKLPLSSLLL